MALAQAILAFLSDQRCSGYDLAKQFNGSVGFFWKASQQQIYRELTRLEEQGWIQPEVVEQEGRPDKKLYSLTDMGQQHLLQWLGEPAELSATREALLVKVFSGHLVSRSVVLAELERHQTLHQEKLAVYQTLEQKFFQNSQNLSMQDKFRYLTLRNGISYETHWINWCREAIRALSDLD